MYVDPVGDQLRGDSGVLILRCSGAGIHIQGRDHRSRRAVVDARHGIIKMRELPRSGPESLHCSIIICGSVRDADPDFL